MHSPANQQFYVAWHYLNIFLWELSLLIIQTLVWELTSLVVKCGICQTLIRSPFRRHLGFPALSLFSCTFLDIDLLLVIFYGINFSEATVHGSFILVFHIGRSSLQDWQILVYSNIFYIFAKDRRREWLACTQLLHFCFLALKLFSLKISIIHFTLCFTKPLPCLPSEIASWLGDIYLTGLNPSIIGGFSGLCAFMGVAATFLSAYLVRQLGILKVASYFCFSSDRSTTISCSSGYAYGYKSFHFTRLEQLD